MNLYNESSIVLMKQSPHTLFCYFNVCDLDIKKVNDKYGEDSWENSKPILKVYEVDKDKENEIYTINLDPFADNWYIPLNRSGSNIRVKIGRAIDEDDIVLFAVSNSVEMPRDKVSKDSTVNYIDTRM